MLRSCVCFSGVNAMGFLFDSARKVLELPSLLRDAFRPPGEPLRTTAVFEGSAECSLDGKASTQHVVAFDGEVLYFGQNRQNLQAVVALGGASVQVKDRTISISEWRADEAARAIVLVLDQQDEAKAWAVLLKAAASKEPPPPVRIQQLREQVMQHEMHNKDMHEMMERNTAKIDRLKTELSEQHGKHKHSESLSGIGISDSEDGSQIHHEPAPEVVGHFDNILLLTDSYKVTHHLQYPPGTETIYSYFESRGGTFKDVCFFGLQYFLKMYLCGSVVTEAKIAHAERFFRAHLSHPVWGYDEKLFNREAWEHILRKHNGRLPILIKAVPEGTVLPVKNVLFTMENTDPKCYWLTNYLETLLVQVWYPMTVCTQSLEQKKIIKRYLQDTGCDSVIDQGLHAFKLHDFGFRGVSSVESAALGSVAHLVHFLGTDTMVGLEMAKEFYSEDCAGFSIPASEHSTMTSWGREREVDAMRNMLQNHPTGLVACVSDSFDIFKACSQYWGTELKALVKSRDGVLIVRPDSGELPAIVLQVLQKLEARFGSTQTSTGHLLLPPYIRVMQGDGIDIDSLEEVLESMKESGWAADNVAFGSGGALLQKVHRDTQKCAFKCSYAIVDGKGIDVLKDPITDPGNNSKKGLLTLECSNGTWTTVTEGGGKPVDDCLVEVFRDGRLLIDDSLASIRRRAEGEIVQPRSAAVARAAALCKSGRFDATKAGRESALDHDLVSELVDKHDTLADQLASKDAEIARLRAHLQGAAAQNEEAARRTEAQAGAHAEEARARAEEALREALLSKEEALMVAMQSQEEAKMLSLRLESLEQHALSAAAAAVAEAAVPQRQATGDAALDAQAAKARELEVIALASAYAPPSPPTVEVLREQEKTCVPTWPMSQEQEPLSTANEPLSTAAVNAIFDALDVNHDGVLSREEATAESAPSESLLRVVCTAAQAGALGACVEELLQERQAVAPSLAPRSTGRLVSKGRQATRGAENRLYCGKPLGPMGYFDGPHRFCNLHRKQHGLMPRCICDGFCGPQSGCQCRDCYFSTFSEAQATSQAEQGGVLVSRTPSSTSTVQAPVGAPREASNSGSPNSVRTQQPVQVGRAAGPVQVYVTLDAASPGSRNSPATRNQSPDQQHVEIFVAASSEPISPLSGGGHHATSPLHAVQVSPLRPNYPLLPMARGVTSPPPSEQALSMTSPSYVAVPLEVLKASIGLPNGMLSGSSQASSAQYSSHTTMLAGRRSEVLAGSVGHLSSSSVSAMPRILGPTSAQGLRPTYGLVPSPPVAGLGMSWRNGGPSTVVLGEPIATSVPSSTIGAAPFSYTMPMSGGLSRPPTRVTGLTTQPVLAQEFQVPHLQVPLFPSLPRPPFGSAKGGPQVLFR